MACSAFWEGVTRYRRFFDVSGRLEKVPIRQPVLATQRGEALLAFHPVAAVFKKAFDAGLELAATLAVDGRHRVRR